MKDELKRAAGAWFDRLVILAIAVMFALGLYETHSRRSADERQRAVLCAVLGEVRAVAEASPRLVGEERASTLEFYDRLLVVAECR